MTYLITGATGSQGGSTARHLLRTGATIHALVRNPSSPASKALSALGAILFEGDFNDIPAIERSLAGGVTGVFLNPPYESDAGAALAACRNVVRAAKAAGTVEVFVVSTAAGVGMHDALSRENRDYPNAAYFAGKAAIEEAVINAGFAHWTVLRPGWLMQNYIPPMSRFVLPGLDSPSHVLVTALLPTTKTPHLDARDVGKFAAAVLREPERFSGLRIDLAAENLTVTDVAGVMSDVAEIEVKAPIARFEDGKAVGVKAPTVGYHSWANSVDTSVDARALSTKYGIQMVGLRAFLEEMKQELEEGLGLGPERQEAES